MAVPNADTPLISVVMANFEAGDKVVHALRSVLRQTMSKLEVIVSDDCSSDDSLERIRGLMAEDNRVRLITATHNAGPAACRNRALDAARGRWIAIVDSDDIIHPERFERLLAAAARQHADIIADDLLLFFEDGTPPRLMLGEDVDTNFAVTPERWVLAGQDGSPALGYLKPLISAERLADLRYDEQLRIGEDYDLILRLLLDGVRMVVVPEPYYLYRRHTGSISHRLSVSDMQAMVDRQDALVEARQPLTRSLTAAFATRSANLRNGLAYERLVASIKQRRIPDAVSLIASAPSHLRRLWTSFSEGRQRREAPPALDVSPLLILGAQGTPGAAQAVPAYVPVARTDWSAPRIRHVWLDLAGRRGIGAVRCVPLDEAGHYAAGFIPEVEIASPP
ncbi:MAG: glycosyltransferase family 2 protein [Candidatus Devosia phytovorans]|uniref:Glycosyltransferase family 2 protein n=1 Tax=Candidatus Devosia phytovorans TaxID=3121372 RepID=A0AAJ5VYK1_9HYPH|nr:glycosyltransferase family 2 protein [Devosia sp.]WEK05807.1 MAG: glycosyltransferase family 2 protein [Devosia sp.]